MYRTNITEKFKVVTVSENTNSFGLHSCIMISQHGIAYKGCASSLNAPKKDDILDVRVKFDIHDKITGYDFTAKGFEIPERMEDAPEEVVDEVCKL